MYGYGARPMLPTVPMFGGLHFCHCATSYNIGSMLTSFALMNTVLQTSMKLFRPFLPANSNNTTNQSSNNYSASNSSNWLFGAFTMPSLNLFSYNSGFIPTPTPVVPFTPIKMDFEPIKFESDYSKVVSKTKKPSKTKSSGVSRKPSTTTSLAEVAKIYDPEKGKKLAQAAIDGLRTADTGYCARAVKTAIANIGLGAYESGHACDMPEILSRNKNFKEVKVDSAKNLPAGCILCYAPGDCNYSSEHGHTEITNGNEQAIHFDVTNNIRFSDKTRVFVPV